MISGPIHYTAKLPGDLITALNHPPGSIPVDPLVRPQPTTEPRLDETGRRGDQLVHRPALAGTAAPSRSYITPMDKTYTVLGSPKVSLAQSVQETVTWLRTQPEFADLPPVSKT